MSFHLLSLEAKEALYAMLHKRDHHNFVKECDAVRQAGPYFFPNAHPIFYEGAMLNIRS